jgi:hypothetical protein
MRRWRFALRTRTGIRIFIEFKDAQEKRITVLIQSLALKAHSALHAETLALLLASSQQIKIDRPTFLTDNKLLAMAVASKKLDSTHIHWNCRQVLQASSLWQLSFTLLCTTSKGI